VEQLDCGMKCFYHLSTGQLTIYPDEIKWGGEVDEKAWGEDMAKVDENFHEYVAFTAMEGHESLRVMEDFIETIAEKRVREIFENTIQRKKPFQQFKSLLFDYPLLRERWFLYKNERYREYVQKQIDDYNVREEFESI